MKSREITPEGLYEVAGRNSEVVFTPKFDQWIEDHPNVIRRVAHLIDHMVKQKEEKVLYGDDIAIEIFPYKRNCFKVTVGDDEFFVKMTNPFKPKEGGATEIKKSAATLQRLKHLKGVRVVDFKLGYQKGDKGYFVSKWENLERAQDLFDSDEMLSSNPVLAQRLSDIYNALGSEYRDTGKHNIFYDKDKDEFVLFDLGY